VFIPIAAPNQELRADRCVPFKLYESNYSRIDAYHAKIATAWGVGWVGKMVELMPPHAEKTFQRLSFVARLLPGKGT